MNPTIREQLQILIASSSLWVIDTKTLLCSRRNVPHFASLLPSFRPRNSQLTAKSDSFHGCCSGQARPVLLAFHSSTRTVESSHYCPAISGHLSNGGAAFYQMDSHSHTCFAVVLPHRGSKSSKGGLTGCNVHSTAFPVTAASTCWPVASVLIRPRSCI